LVSTPQIIRIKENAIIALLAAIFLQSKTMAVTIGSTINLHGCNKEEFLANNGWLKHELKHVAQYKQLGFSRFLLKYFLQWLQYGYKKSPLEREAVAAESQEIDLHNFKFL
jgi:hypothetical protein